MNTKQLKQRALQSIEGNVFSRTALNIIGYGLLVSVLTSIAGMTFIGAIIIGGPLSYGLNRIMVRISRGNSDVSVSNLFDGFKESFLDSFLLYLLQSLFIALWSLLLVIPGIVKSYSYSLAFFIQQDSKNKNWNYCLQKSTQLMHGYKMSAFMLDLSFLGWFLLGFLTCGIGLIFVLPYYSQARTHFYNEILRKHNIEFESNYEPAQNTVSSKTVNDEFDY